MGGRRSTWGAETPGQKPKTGWAPKPPMGQTLQRATAPSGTRWPDFVTDVPPIPFENPIVTQIPFSGREAVNSTEQSHHNTTVAPRSSRNQSDYKSENKKKIK